MDCSSFEPPVDATILKDCIQLCRQVSKRAEMWDFRDPVHAVARIQVLESHGTPVWWRTWFRKTRRGKVDVCAFFQRMKDDGGYAMCLGFQPSLLGPNDALSVYKSFLEEISGNGIDDGLLRFFILKCLQQTQVRMVMLAANHPHSDAGFDKRRNHLFEAAQSLYDPTAGHPHWKLVSGGPYGHRHWGNQSDNELWNLISQ